MTRSVSLGYSVMPDPVIPALLLAAGLGTRLVPLTNRIPKCLVPIHGKPLLEYWLDLLGNAGMTPLIVNTHHHAGAVWEFAAESPWRDRLFVVHENELLGTGGTMMANRGLLEHGVFFVAHADNLSRFRFEDFLLAHSTRPSVCVMTMMLFRTPTPQTCGIVETDERGVAVAFHEKVEDPPGNLANAAVYLMEPEVLDILAAVGKEKPDISLDLVPRCLGRINTWLNTGYHRDIGTPESYQAALAEYPVNEKED